MVLYFIAKLKSMKTFLYILVCILVYTKSFGQDAITTVNLEEIQGIPMVSPNQTKETKYFKECVSDVGVSKYKNQPLIYWSVCGDESESYYLLYKSIDNQNYELISFVQNIPSVEDVPIMYQLQDSSYTGTSFYRLSKHCSSGNLENIVTLLVYSSSNDITKQTNYNGKF